MTLKLRNHPSKQALLAYAENLVDGQSGIDRDLAAHLSQCAQCKAEVQAMKASLSFTSSAPELDPSSDLTARILLSGKSARTEMRRPVTPLRIAFKVAQVSACAAALLVVMGLSFGSFLDSPDQEMATPSFDTTVPVVVGQNDSPEAMRRASVEVAAEVHTLSAAVEGKLGSAPSPEALGEIRAVHSRDGDIAAAMSVLKRDPNNVRATQVVHATLKRQAESLRAIYVEGDEL